MSINDKIEIVRVSLSDLPQLQKIGKQTFLQTFAKENSEDNMRMYVKQSFSKKRITSELKNPDSEFYFAIVQNHVVGYLKLNFSKVQTELQDDHALEIERIYVLKKFQGKEIGQALYEKALHIARQRKSSYVWLGVWEKNVKAIKFYKKNNFVPFNTHIFKLGEDEQTDILMKMELL